MNPAKSRIMNLANQKEIRHELRIHSTAAESTLWKLLKGKSIGGLKFRRQHGVGPYVLDFYCSALLLCIELDGEVHRYAEEYDDARTKYLKEVAGITVLRYENRVVFENPEMILREVEEMLAKRRESTTPLATPLATPSATPLATP